MTLSIKEFISKYQGKVVDVPWGWAGECVSLVQRYVNECFDLPLYRSNGDVYARGNGVDFGNTLVRDGDAVNVSIDDRRYGDIAIYDYVINGKNYGHVDIVLSKIEVFDQTTGQRKNANVRPPLKKIKQVVRMKKAPIPDKEESKPSSGSFKQGDIVYVATGAKSYDGVSVSSIWYSGKHSIDELVGDRTVLDIGTGTTAFNVRDLIHYEEPSKPVKPSTPEPVIDRTGQLLVIYTQYLQGNKDVVVTDINGKQIGSVIPASKDKYNRVRKYRIVKQVEDGFYQVEQYRNEDPIRGSGLHIRWRSGIGFEKV